MSPNSQFDQLPPDYKLDPDGDGAGGRSQAHGTPDAPPLSRKWSLDRRTLVLAMILALLVEAAVFALSPNLTHALFGQPREVYCTTVPALPSPFSDENP
jgi:hypothetical protein